MTTHAIRSVLMLGVLALDAAAGGAPTPRKDFLGDPLPERALFRIGTTRLQQFFASETLAVSADGRLVASYAQRTIRVWDTRDGKLLRAFELSDWGPWACAFSADGRELAATSPPSRGRAGKGNFRRWDLANGRELQNDKDPEPPGTGFFGASGTVVSVALACRADDGYRVAEGNGTDILVRRTGAPKAAQTLKGHTGRVMDVAFTQDGKTLVSLGDDGAIRTWDVAKGTEIAKIAAPAKLNPGLKGNMAWLAVAPDGKTLAATLPDGSVRLLDASGRERCRLDCEKSIQALAIAPDGKSVYTGGPLIRKWDVQTGAEIPILKEPRNPLVSLALAPDGKIAAFADDHDRLRLAEIATGTTVFEARIPCGGGIAFTPDGKHLATASDKTIAFWDVARLLAEKKPGPEDRAAVVPCADKVVAFALSPDGRRVAVAEQDGLVHIYAIAAKREVLSFAALGNKILAEVFRNQLFSVSYSPDGKLLATVGSANMGPIFIRGEDQKMKQRVPQTTRLWDAATGKEVSVSKELGLTAYTVAFHPASKLLAALHLSAASRLPVAGDIAPGAGPSAEDCMETIRLWDVAARCERFRFDDPEQRKMGALASVWITSHSAVEPVAFTRDGRLFAAPGMGGIVLFETASGRPRLRLGMHLNGTSAFAFTPDGRTLVSASRDSTVLIWDVTGLRTGPKRAGTAEQLWATLASANAERAGQAIWAMVDQSAESARVLRSRLKPAPADAPSLAQLIANLDDEDFATRDRAMRQLAIMGPTAAEALTAKLRARPSLETTRRIEQLLRGMQTAPPPEQLQAIRGVEVLERIGTAAARAHLAELAAGGEGPWVTSEARAALARLKR